MRMGKDGGAMRRSIWGPVAVCVLALVASALLPHAGVRSWSTPVAAAPGAKPAALAGRASLMPSWPVPAFRHRPESLSHTAVWAVLAPSWPVPALRQRALAVPPRAGASRSAAVSRPVAGPIARERVLLGARVRVSMFAAFVVAWLIAGRPLTRSRRLATRHVRIAHTITQLAEQGVAQSRIAAEARLPRDAVRALLRQSSAQPVRRRG